MARDSLVREAVRKTAVGRFDSGPCLFGAHAVDGRGRVAPGRVEARRLSPTVNGVVRVRVPLAGLSGGSSIGRALDDPVCAPHIRPPSCRPWPPSPRLRCGHGSKTAGYLSAKQKPSGSRCLIRAGTGGAAGRVEDGRLSRDRKASRFESCPLPSRRPGAAQPQSVRGELRLPDPTSARAATLQLHHIRPDGRAEPK